MKKEESIVLKQVEIENAFGLRELELSFELKKMKNAESTDQLINIEEGNFCMVPTFIAKNASGKTSLIKAIDFATRLINKKSFIENITNYAIWIFQKINFEIKSNEFSFNAKKFLDEIFKQVVFAGAEEMKIKLAFTQNNLILVELTRSSFEIKINNQIIDVIKILEKMFEENLENKTRTQIVRYFKENISLQIKNYSFLPIFSDSLYRDTHHITTLGDFLLKENANRFLKRLANHFGFPQLRFLLKKLDPKISNLEYNPTNKLVSIYMKETSDFAIPSHFLSFGTLKTIEILAKSIKILENGGLYLIDEIENGLHLSLIKLILAFYNSKEINQKNAQIILTTHNPLIFKEDVVSKFNAFMVENNNFINIKDHKAINRTEDQIGFISPKNYYNDYYWELRDTSSHTTISDIEIDLTINNILEANEFKSKTR